MSRARIMAWKCKGRRRQLNGGCLLLPRRLEKLRTGVSLLHRGSMNWKRRHQFETALRRAGVSHRLVYISIDDEPEFVEAQPSSRPHARHHALHSLVQHARAGGVLRGSPCGPLHELVAHDGGPARQPPQANSDKSEVRCRPKRRNGADPRRPPFLVGTILSVGDWRNAHMSRAWCDATILNLLASCLLCCKGEAEHLNAWSDRYCDDG